MMNKLFIDICQPDKEIVFVLILEKIELCATSYSTNLAFSQISNLQYSVTGTKGAFVPGRGWFIFGGNSDYTQTQQLQSIDGTWTTGNPTFQPDSHYCIVQVMKLQMQI